MYVVERGSITDPRFLTETGGWTDDPMRAATFPDDDAATRAAVETGADELRVTELEE